MGNTTTSGQRATTRPAAVAGAFYPGDATELSDWVDRLMAEALAMQGSAAHKPPIPKAIIVPHAGYKFSGAVAATGYVRVAPIADRIRRVVLFGPAHRVAVRGLGVPSTEAFTTPLGRVNLDQENLEILKAQPYTAVSDEAHAQEHSLEVQLPFLQKILGDFQLTPVAVGMGRGDVVADALKRVWGGPETLIVISSDLSHYHDYEEAQRRDSAASMAIMSLSAGRLRSEDACGWRPVDGMLRRARDLDLKPTTLDIRNSGDTASPHDRVVGYGSWAFTEEIDPSRLPLSDFDKQELIRIAATVVHRAATGKSFPKISVGTFSAAIQRPGASFITLSRNGRLRGCLGSLQAHRPLVLDVAERGYASALKDSRFEPVRSGELPGMHMEVAVLTGAGRMTFRDEAELLDQLRPGTDGLIIQDQDRRATFLPKVWDEIREPAVFLKKLKQKAGLAPDHWSESFSAWRYETERFGTQFPSV